jgi:RNA polymerase sigma-70 factor (ECF subfamily)
MSEPSPYANLPWSQLLVLLERGVSAPADYRLAWEEAYRRVSSYAFRILRGRGFSHDDIDDLVQGVMVKLQGSRLRSRLSLLRAPTGYLVRMIRFAATDLQRRQQSEKKSLEAWAWHQSILDNEGHGSDFDLLLSRVWILLSDEEQELLQMRFSDDLSMPEIAQRLGVSYSAAAVRLFRLVRKLREELRDPGPS